MRASASDEPQLDGFVAPFTGWSLVEVGGAHRERFLGSQLTSDVAGLAIGESQLSSLLDRTGRVQAFFFLCKSEAIVELLVPEEVVGHCVERLESHIIADDVTIARRDVGAMRLVLGPAAVALGPDATRFPVSGWGSCGFVTWGDPEIDLPAITGDELETLRVLGGPPAWGVEVRPGQLVNETALLDAAVAFDKGCFLGQETVAKVASHRGAVRAPVLLEVDDPTADLAGLEGSVFAVGERTRAGEVLSTAVADGRSWLQASLHRELRVAGRELRCEFADGLVVVGVIRTVPVTPPPSREEMAERLTVAASAAFAEDRNDRALELLERAVTVCPTSADAFESLGVILGRLGRHPEAIEQMRRLIEIDPSSVMAHSNLSLFHNQLGEIEKAEHHLAMATRLSFGGGPTPEPESREREEREEREADQRRREEMFSQVLEIDPHDVLAHFGLGELSVERGDHSAAVKHLEKALAGDPAHSAAMLALGSALEGLDEIDRARETYDRGIETAAKKGDLATAQKMQERLNSIKGRR